MPTTLAANALTTLATVKTELGISVATYDDQLTRLINACSDAAEQYCGRSFYTRTVTAEKHPAKGGRLLWVDVTPLTTLTSISYDGTTVPSGDYEIYDATTGAIISTLDAWNNDNLDVQDASGSTACGTARKFYSIAYVGGYVMPTATSGTRNFPYDLEQAAIDLVCTQWAARGSDRRVASESLMSYSVSYADQVGGIPAGIAAVLNKYRRPICA